MLYIPPLNAQGHVIRVVRVLVFRFGSSYDHSVTMLVIVKRVDQITTLSGFEFLLVCDDNVLGTYCRRCPYRITDHSTACKMMPNIKALIMKSLLDRRE